MPQCCAIGCFSQQVKGKIFHCLPSEKSDTIRRNIWLNKIGRKNWTPSINSRLCADHFTPDQYEQNRKDGRRKLKPNAVPSIFKNSPSSKTDDPVSKESQTVFATTSTDLSRIESSGQHMIFISEHVLETEKHVFEVEKQKLLRKIQLLQKKNRRLEIEKKQLESATKSLFNDDQLKYLVRGSMKGASWSMCTIQKALKLRNICGCRGYSTLRDMGFPLPCVRTLQQKIQNIKMRPGILDFTDALEGKISLMNEYEREAVLMIDEMALTPSLTFDISSDIRRPTIPNAMGEMDELATHALVFMLGGLSSRWKQTVAYHLTSNSFCPQTIKDFLFNLIKLCEAKQLCINVVIMDIGGQNQALLKKCGIISGKYSQVVNYCSHPCNNERKLFFMYDTPHLLKNLRNFLTSGQNIELPEDILIREKLPCSFVSIKYIEELLDLDVQHDLKLAPHLQQAALQSSHYERMKVGLATAVFSQEVAAALEYLVNTKKIEQNALTTAWFLKTIHRCFRLISSRSRETAMSYFHTKEYEEATEFMKVCLSMFSTMKIGNSWKPVQTGLILTTTTALQLQEFYLCTKKFEFVLLSRFSQDALENLFSIIRRKNPIPTAKEFETALRTICAAQFFKPSRNGNCEIDDSDFLLEYIKTQERALTATDSDVLQYESSLYKDNTIVDFQSLENNSTFENNSAENMDFSDGINTDLE